MILMTIDDIISRCATLPAADIAKDVNRKLDENNSLVVTAPPGAGKSTLLPLTIMAGTAAGKIMMLEPRRLAARQIAERMAEILGEPVGKTVGYRVRFESRVSEATRIEVVTEGVFLRMLVDDPTLDGVSVVIFDEFHERSINSDLALALVRQSQTLLRDDLRLVLMSATIDATSLCHTLHAPLVESQGRMFPVEVVHADDDTIAMASSRRNADIPLAVARMVSRAHRESDGDILVFLPGQAEIQRVADLLGDSLLPTAVMPLYGNLSPEAQHRAIAPSAGGKRKVVLATPVAETSLTIEGVRVVVDAGLCRRPVFNARSGLTHLDTVAISKDMMTQRTGRAGRVAAGTCYRLWTVATENQLADQRRPEIEEADLAPMLLQVAAFGERDILSLPWITPPSAGSVGKAQHLLKLLGAVDADGAITAMGRQMAAMPCHPRVARMILGCRTREMKSLACDIAAILEEKDPLTAEESADLTIRIGVLRSCRSKKNVGRWQRIAMISREYQRMTGADEDNAAIDAGDAGLLIAYAYPERVAMATDDVGGYRLASGDNASLPVTDALSASKWIAVASLYSQSNGGRIYLAAPVDVEQMETTSFDNVAWNSKEGMVVMRREQRIGKLIVGSKPIHDADKDRVVEIVCDAVRKDGLSMLDWNDGVARLQNRVAAVAAWHPDMELPDISTPHLMQTAGSWLPMYLVEGNRVMTSVAEMKKLDLRDIIWATIPYDKQQEIERLAPEHVVVPTGSRIRIDYRQGAAAPVVSVRLQECFGMMETPTVDDGRQPLLMELLSPGFKPVQLTQDLANFWRETYFDVRKELKRRYPKHCWPDNPLDAKAVRK